MSAVLPFSRPEYNRRKQEQAGRLSISGVQSKYSLQQNGTRLDMTETDGEYILKPYVPGGFENMEDMPANEHVTMQIAKQVFKMDVAECALVFFKDEQTPAYLTRRFDVMGNGEKRLQEDFAQIAQMSEDTNGNNYKYEFSYEEISMLLKKLVSTYTLQAERFFQLVLFNYFTNNGDAHLKNFSLFYDPLLESHLLTPAYDLLNTRLHLPSETALALDLFKDDFTTESYVQNAFYAYDDFMAFGEKILIRKNRIEKYIHQLSDKEDDVYALLDTSFLSEESKQTYKKYLMDRLKAIRYSFLTQRAL
ncbi:MAG: HipA domain-containing protein [Fibrobacteria bacterium]|nr:HipA domain-containing protein [Fibrobacteria bacterium]